MGRAEKTLLQKKRHLPCDLKDELRKPSKLERGRGRNVPGRGKSKFKERKKIENSAVEVLT